MSSLIARLFGLINGWTLPAHRLAAQAKQASYSLSLLAQLEQQDSSLLKASRHSSPSAAQSASNTDGCSTPDGHPAHETREPLLQHLTELQQLQRQLPASQLKRLAQWALQEGISAMMAHVLSKGANFNLNSIKDRDPWGILMGMVSDANLRPITPHTYVETVQRLCSTAPGLVLDPSGPTSVLSYCKARTRLVRAWMITRSQWSAKLSDEAQQLVADRLHSMTHQVAAVQGYCHHLATWQEAHQFMLARDRSQVDRALANLRVQLQVLYNETVKHEAEQVLERVSAAWMTITQLGVNHDTASPHAAPISTPAQQHLGQADGQGSTDLPALCNQLMADVALLSTILYPNRTVSTEVSVILAEYEAEVSARLAQLGPRPGL